MKLYYKGSQEEEERCDCNKGHDDHRCDGNNECCDKHKYAHCCPKSPCPYPILFECTQGTGTSISKTNENFQPRSLGCITIDTSCLNNPVVKVDFSSTIKYKDNSNTEPTTLLFGLFKNCDDKQEIPCGTWQYTIAFNEANEELTTTFCFSHCECGSCPGCCVYTVKIIDAENENGDTLIISDPSLSVIAKSSH